MQQVIPYVSKHDPLKPDFVQECVNDMTIRPECGGLNPEKPNDKQNEAIFAKQEKYYIENWHRALLSLIRYKNPAVANADSHSLLSFRDNPKDPLYFHVDFVKPGKCTYFVEFEHKTTEVDVDMSFLDALAGISPSKKEKKQDKKISDSNVFIHKMLAQFRQEEIISCK